MNLGVGPKHTHVSTSETAEYNSLPTHYMHTNGLFPAIHAHHLTIRALDEQCTCLDA